MTETTKPNSSLVRAGEDPRVLNRIEKIRSLLVPDETLECHAVQRRVFALAHRRIVVACTSGRVLILRANVLPGFSLQDARWQDLRDAHLREGIFGSLLTIRTEQFTTVVPGLRKDEAQVVYRMCQAQEQAWREKNRVRSMEEARARAGGVQITQAAGVPSAAGAADDAKARLQRAKEMLDAGLITDTEYEATKAKVLAAL